MPKKQFKKPKATKPAASGIQKEVAELGPYHILPKRTRGGDFDVTSPAQKVVHEPIHKPIISISENQQQLLPT